MLPPQTHEVAHELAQHLVFRTKLLPFQPGDVVILAIGVVVAALGVADLVAGEQHRHPQRQEQRGEQVAFLLVAQADDRRIISRSFDPAIPAEVRLVTVAVVLAIGLVVLVVVADQVVQRETVMGGDEVDARPRPPAATIRAPCRLSRSAALSRGPARSTRPSPAACCRADSRTDRDPTARRSA